MADQLDKKMLTNEDFQILASKFLDVAFDHFGPNPTTEDMGRVVGACRVLETSITGMMKDRGVEVQMFDLGEKQ